jgi:hypothetical protein
MAFPFISEFFYFTFDAELEVMPSSLPKFHFWLRRPTYFSFISLTFGSLAFFGYPAEGFQFLYKQIY